VSFKIAEDRGFDPKTHWFEHMDNRPNQLHVPPGIYNNSDFMSSLDGLYVIGDAMAGNHDVANASVSGFLVGDTVHEYINDAADPVIDEAQVESQKEVVQRLMAVNDGPVPLEMESALRYINQRYVGMFRAEGKLREGTRRLGSVRREFLDKIMTKGNPHHLMRALEVRNLFDVSQLHIEATMERKETRIDFIRLDYPEPDPAWDDMLSYQRLENGKRLFETRKQAEIDMDYVEERSLP